MKKLKVLNNENGFIKFFFIVAVIVFLVYVGVKFGMPYYKYSAFKSDIKEMVRVSLGDDNKTKTEVLQRAQELKIPIGEKDVEVKKQGNIVVVTTSWSETVDLLGLYQKTLDFDIAVEG
jgi:hypothetical protein